MDQDNDKAVKKQQVNQEVDEVGLRVSDSSFDSGEEPKDESDLD